MDTQKISGLNPELISLKSLSARVPNPRSYFKGVPAVKFEIPKNLVMFNRTKSEDLSQDFSFHYHHRFVLIVNLGGQGNVVVDNHLYEFDTGEAVLIFPYQFHHYPKMEESNIDWLFITFEMYSPASIEDLKNQVLKISETATTYITHLTDLYLTKKKEDNDRATMFLLTSLILTSLQQASGKKRSISSAQVSVIDKINAYIWDNIGEKIKLPELAQNFMISESHMRLIFRKKMGISIGHYIQKLKVNRARSFLINSDLNISEVAFRCGYDSLYTFSRAFKKNTGMSPRAYQKKMTNSEELVEA